MKLENIVSYTQTKDILLDKDIFLASGKKFP